MANLRRSMRLRERSTAEHRGLPLSGILQLRGVSINFFPDRTLPGVDVEAPRAGAAAVDDTAFGVYEIQPLGKRGVGGVDGVAHVVERHRHCEAQVEHARAGRLGPFFFGLGLFEDDTLVPIHRYLPAVVGVGLLYVDAEELDAVAISLIDFVQANRLIAEGRSGVGAEHNRDRPASKV